MGDAYWQLVVLWADDFLPVELFGVERPFPISETCKRSCGNHKDSVRGNHTLISSLVANALINRNCLIFIEILRLV